MMNVMSSSCGRRTNWAVAAVAIVVFAGCSSNSTQAVETAKPTTTTLSTSPTSSAACPTSDLTATIAYATIRGADANLTSLDVYRPTTSTCDAPVVMWVHGGGYQIGDKRNQIRDKVALFNKAGWILVSVNYRLTKPGQADSAVFPDHFNDVATAVGWVHDHIGSYGGDPSRIALLGHSAGADIVANVATDPAYLEGVGLGLSAIRCAGPLDTEGFDKVAAGASDPDGEREQWKVALGNAPDYLTRTSASLRITASTGIPPMVGVVRGTAQRQQIETAFLARLTAAGIKATTIDARSLTHSQVNTNIGASDDNVMTAPLMEFLTSCFR